MLKPKPVVLVQNELPDFKYVLNKRKKSTKEFLQVNQINTVTEFNSWISANKNEYSFSESFIAEAASFLTPEVKAVIATPVPSNYEEKTDVETLPSYSFEPQETNENTLEFVGIPVKEKSSKRRNKNTQIV